MSDGVKVAVVSGISGIIIAYITNVVAQRVQARKAAKQPKDRMEQMFDGYERLIRQKDMEDDRKGKSIKTLEQNVTALETELLRTRQQLEDTMDELKVSREENRELKTMLDQMRKEYKHVKR